MSFTRVEPGTVRLNRSQLFVPAIRVELFEKAAESDADILSFDLEDAVAPADKSQARENLIKALQEMDFGSKSVSVRINGLDTPFCYRDIVDVLEQGGERLDLIMIPKAGTASDVYAVDMLVTQIEMAVGRRKRIGLEVLIESALGLENVNAIAAASKRLESIHFGAADFAASTGMRTTDIGLPSPDYAVLTDPDAQGERDRHWNDVWHYPLMRMVAAARASGLRPIDGPFGNFADAAGFEAQAKRAAVLGCEGKWAIHPSQVGLANDVFTPLSEDVKQARRIVKAMKEGARDKLGAVTLNGRLIDAASIRQAEGVVKKSRLISRRQVSARTRRSQRR